MQDPEYNVMESKCLQLTSRIKALEVELASAKVEYTHICNKLDKLKTARTQKETKRKVEILNRDLDEVWIERQFDWSEQLKQLLVDKFKFSEFRPKQLAAINATLSKNDVLLVMPTGGGKSLVYQLPALIDDGFSLIVCPLISLIEDQLISLEKHGIVAATIHGGCPKTKTKTVYQQMLDKNSNLKLLYVTPEWIAKSKQFMGQLTKCHEANLIARVAIDEVHCCSNWGHDFRPDFAYLGILRTMLSTVPFIGLTATATMGVLTDVQTMLNLENCMIITAPFNRPNLYYEVLTKFATKEANLDFLEQLIKEKYSGQSGIIYTTTITESKNLTSALKGRGITVGPYHAQLDPEHKKKIHRKWLDGTFQLVVATVAFGMGIDKPDVRFVIHYCVPKSMESLYQESGRAGRNGERADCILLFSLNDYFRILGMVSSLNEEKKAFSVLQYCLNSTTCRRALISTHFEETYQSKDCHEMCDHCATKKSDSIHYDISSACKDIHLIIDQAQSNGDKLTLNKLLDGWFHTGAKKLRVSTLKVPKISRQQAENIISVLLLKNYLKIDKGYNTYTTICYIKKGTERQKSIKMLSSSKYSGFTKLCSGEPAPKKVKH